MFKKHKKDDREVIKCPTGEKNDTDRDQSFDYFLILLMPSCRIVKIRVRHALCCCSQSFHDARIKDDDDNKGDYEKQNNSHKCINSV